MTTISLFIRELTIAHHKMASEIQERQYLARETPVDTVVALRRVTNDEPALVPNKNGEFLYGFANSTRYLPLAA